MSDERSGDPGRTERARDRAPVVPDWRELPEGGPASRSAGVEIYRLRLDSPGDGVLSGGRLPVTDRERDRAERYERPADRARYLAARALIRLLAGARLAADPTRVSFRRADHGKPRLARDDSGDRPFAFNLSHADGWILAALSTEGPVGVDLEPAERTDGAGGVAERVLRGEALARWRARDEAERPALFMRLWTAKEAALKATGEGLYCGPERASCRFESGRIVRVEFDPDAEGVEHLHWDVRSFRAGPGAVGALAGPPGGPSDGPSWWDATTWFARRATE